MHGYQLRIASTPNGIGGMFYELWSDDVASNGWAGHEIPIEMAISDGMAVDIEDCRRIAKGDPRLFSQMFECKFLDGANQYIPTSLIDAATAQWNGRPPRGVATFGGLDIGRTNDLTCLIVVAVDRAGKAWVIACETLSRTEPEDLDRPAQMAFGVYGVNRLVVDSTGIGEMPAASLRKRYGLMRVEPYTFTQASKEHLATLLYQDFADNTVTYDPTNTGLTEDLCSIRRIVTEAGTVRYDAPRTEKGHADRAWALSLALHGCRGPDRRRHETPGA
jgi:phage FluMu gp28-like protein